MIEILILLLMMIQTLVLCTGFGLLIGTMLRPKRGKTAPAPTPEQLLRQQRAEQEMKNFFAYDGSEQMDINAAGRG